MDRVIEQLTDRMATILGNQNHRRPPTTAGIDEEEEEYEEEVLKGILGLLRPMMIVDV